MDDLRQNLIEKLVELGYSREMIAVRGLETVLREAGVLSGKKNTARKAAQKELKLPEPKSPFQAWLIGEMRKNGLSQADLARALGITSAYVSRLFAAGRGEKQASALMVVRFAQAFRVSPLVVLAKIGLLEEPAENSLPVIERAEFLSPENRRVIQLLVDGFIDVQEGS